jgi:hypothetical protein
MHNSGTAQKYNKSSLRHSFFKSLLKNILACLITTSNSNRVGAPIIPPSNELMSTPMTETVVIAREEYETLLSTVRQLTNTVEGLSRQVARLEQDTAAHERSLALYDYEEGGSLESQPAFQSVRTGGPRTGSRGEAASSSTVGDEEEDSAENRRLFRVKLYVEKKAG